MSTSVHKNVEKRGITCTVYNPCINNDDFSNRLAKLKHHFFGKSSLVGIVAANPNKDNVAKKYINTRHGKFVMGSTLGHQLNPFDESFDLITNIKNRQDQGLVMPAQVQKKLINGFHL